MNWTLDSPMGPSGLRPANFLVMRIGSLFSFSARYDRNVVPGCEWDETKGKELWTAARVQKDQQQKDGIGEDKNKRDTNRNSKSTAIEVIDDAHRVVLLLDGPLARAERLVRLHWRWQLLLP